MNEILSKLRQFVGYGSKNAKVIFIGIEEKTNDDKDAKPYEKRLAIQRKLEPFTDLNELCDQLDGLYNPQTATPQPQPTWKPLCSVMLGIEGNDRMGDDGEIKKYQKEKLGRIDRTDHDSGDTLLAELLPVLKSRASRESGFGEIHSRFLGISKIEYYGTVLRERQTLLAKAITERFAGGPYSPPRLILAYGRPWRDFEAIFGKVREMLEEHGQMQYNCDPQPVRIDDRPFPRFKWAKMKGCLFILTYHPAAREKWEPLKFGIPVASEIVKIYRKEVEGTAT